MYRVYSPPPIAGRHPVMPRDTAGGGVSYFCSTIVFNPLALRALPLYFATQNTGGEGEMYIPFSLPMSRSLTENCVSHIGKYTRTIPVNYRLSQNLVEIVF